MKRFKKVYIEITNICNLDCNFCPKTKRTPKLLNEAEFSRIVKEIKPYTDYVYFHLMGEPFLNEHLGRFLEICHENSLKVNITTNGTLIHKVKELLLQSPALRQVNFSLSSFEANDNIGELEEYLNEIGDFILKASEETQIISSLRLWNLDSETLKASNSKNLYILSVLEKLLNLDFSLREKLQTTNQIKLKEKIYLNMAEKFEWPDLGKELVSKEVFCYGLRDQIGILVDGTVVPCCLDSEGTIALGNIYETKLNDILESVRAKKIYDGFSNRCAVEELCKRCPYAKRY